jgi:Sulfotransferase family
MDGASPSALAQLQPLPVYSPSSVPPGKTIVPEIASRPLFIVSMWRGGSSLLHVLLNKHPQVALMFEADLLLLRPVFLKPSSLNDWSQRWELWNQAFSRHGLDPADFASTPAEFRAAFEDVHREYARRKGAAIWGDKSPNYHDQLVDTAEVFPNAQFIIVWRDPVETIGATLRAAANGSRYFRKRGMPWRSLLGYRVFKRQSDQIVAAGFAVHQLQYEDLVNDTAAVMRKVCDFLKIPYDDRVSTLEGADRSAVYAGRHHNLLRNNEILAGPRPNAIDPALRRRIERYVNLWREIDAGNSSPSSRKGLSSAQLSVDRLRYRCYRILDLLIRMGFCFLPKSLLHAYRKLKLRKVIADSIEPALLGHQP